MNLTFKELIKGAAARVACILPKNTVRQLRRFDYKIRGVEPEIDWLEKWCDREKTAIDIGANRGDYALFLSQIANRLICFEPNPGLAKELEELLDGLSVKVENLALGNEEGEFELNIPYVEGKELHGWASLEKDFAGESWKGLPIQGVRKVKVFVKRLDDLNIENVGFIKIDVEGHEFATLKGARETILRDKPNLLVEIEQRHHEDPIDEIFKWMASLGYEGSFLDDGGMRPLSEFDLDFHQKCPETAEYRNNFFFSPKS